MSSTRQGVVSLLAFLFASVSVNAAAWTFDDEDCSPETTHTLSLSTPNLYIMLDHSGSMDDPGGPNITRWAQARDGLVALMNESQTASPPIAHFGYGKFSTSATNLLGCAVNQEGAVKTQIADQTKSCGGGDPVPSSVCVRDGGWTATAGAITTAYGSSCFADPSVPSAVVLVTDGEPTVASSPPCSGTSSTCLGRASREAYHAACDNRSKAPLFVVGLGDGTDIELNNFLTAAGNTGACLNADGDEVDPCAPSIRAQLTGDNWRSNIENWTCSGSVQANNTAELILALQSITNRLQCTFPIDFLNSNIDSVPEDPTNDYEYLAVKLYEGANPIEIYHRLSSQADPAGEGWTFTSEARQFIEFTEHYCDNIQAAKYTRATTQLACMCQQELGAPCSVPNAEELNICPDGVWTCVEGQDICEPETDCCIPGLECDTGDVGRCGPGISHCDGATFSCIPINAGMPELCNGIDDNCDGKIDNLREYWEDIATPELHAALEEAEQESAACNFQDVCMCPNGPADMSNATTFGGFLADHNNHCLCGEGLAPSHTDGPPATLPDRSTNVQPTTGCTVAGGASGGLAALIVLGLVALRRRF